MRLAPIIDHGAEGGPWCTACGHWTEVNGDAAAGNVCVRCGRPAVVMRPPNWTNRVRAARGGKVLSAGEVHALFEEMRKAVGGDGEVKGLKS